MCDWFGETENSVREALEGFRRPIDEYDCKVSLLFPFRRLLHLLDTLTVDFGDTSQGEPFLGDIRVSRADE